MRYLIEHESVLRFPRPVREHQIELRLAPREDASQRRLACEIEVEPAAPLRTHLDCFGNLVHRVSLLAPHDSLRARVRAEVETALSNPFDYAPLEPAAERAWLEQRLRDDPGLLDFVLHRSDQVPEIAGGEIGGIAPPPYAPERGLLPNLVALLAFAGATFRYVPGATDVHAALAEFAEQRAGVCQDFAHFVVAVARSWGCAARYVMGYVDPGAVSADEGAQATHAWAEVLIPGAGWRGFDATAGLVANDSYVPVAVGRDSHDAAPLRGTFKGDDGGLPPHVAVRVARLAEEQQAQ